MKLTEPFMLPAMRVKHKPTEDDRKRLGGVPRMDGEIDRIRWHMHHDVSYMFTSKHIAHIMSVNKRSKIIVNAYKKEKI